MAMPQGDEKIERLGHTEIPMFGIILCALRELGVRYIQGGNCFH